MTTFQRPTIEIPEDSAKPKESKRERRRKRQRGSSSKTDEEINMICGQYGDQVDQDDDQTSGVRFEEINQKLDSQAFGSLSSN